MNPTIDEKIKRAKEVDRILPAGPWRNRNGAIVTADDVYLNDQLSPEQADALAESRTLLPALVAECERMKESIADAQTKAICIYCQAVVPRIGLLEHIAACKERDPKDAENLYLSASLKEWWACRAFLIIDSLAREIGAPPETKAEDAGPHIKEYVDGLRSELARLTAAAPEWTSERPTSGKWWVAIHPRERGRWLPVLETVITEAGIWMPTAVNGVAPFSPMDPVFAGALWFPRVTPADPFARAE